MVGRPRNPSTAPSYPPPSANASRPPHVLKLEPSSTLTRSVITRLASHRTATNQNGMTHCPAPQRAHRPSVIACLMALAICSMYLEAALAQDPARRVTIDAPRVSSSHRRTSGSRASRRKSKAPRATRPRVVGPGAAAVTYQARNSNPLLRWPSRACRRKALPPRRPRANGSAPSRRSVRAPNTY